MWASAPTDLMLRKICRGVGTAPADFYTDLFFMALTIYCGGHFDEKVNMPVRIKFNRIVIF